MSYPAMSVYEFEHFKEEADVLRFWETSSIYMICQRPVLYFDNIMLDAGEISMKIRQRGDARELSVRFTPAEEIQLPDNNKDFWVDLEFYDPAQQTEQPYRNVAGIKLLNDKQEFIVWLTPERLLFLYIKGKLKADIEGQIHEFLTYSVHYIGQAQNQNIWDRLTGHEKLSKVLALEHPFITGEFSPYELSLIFLKFDGFSEGTILPLQGPKDIDTKDNEDIADAFIPRTIEDVKEFAINDFEAYLINFFQPKYNKKIYKSYPNIANGLRSINYDVIQHSMLLYACIVTEEATYSIKISPIYAEQSKKET